MLLGPFVSRIGRKKIGFMGIAKTSKKDLDVIKELLEVGKVVPIIDKCFMLSETADAIRYLVEEHAQGKVVITVEHSVDK
jgi:NADPH:quinone reductase-like Zn-dependent oxidoreductase